MLFEAATAFSAASDCEQAFAGLLQFSTLRTQAWCSAASFFAFCNTSRFPSPGGKSSSTSGTEHCASSQMPRRTASAETCRCHAVSFAVLHTATFCLSCILNLKGKLLGCVSYRELREENKLDQSLLVETCICTTIMGQPSFLCNLQSAVRSRCSLHLPSQLQVPPRPLQPRKDQRSG